MITSVVVRLCALPRCSHKSNQLNIRIMKYNLKSVRIRLDNGVLITNRLNCQTNSLEGLRRMYKDRYGASSIMFTYETHE